jgi:hypothetical protein
MWKGTAKANLRQLLYRVKVWQDKFDVVHQTKKKFNIVKKPNIRSPLLHNVKRDN